MQSTFESAIILSQRQVIWQYPAQIPRIEASRPTSYGGTVASAEHQTIITFHVGSRADMESSIETGESLLRTSALQTADKGILVTRHSPHDFTMELHPEVPFGTTRERQEW
jgi:hypothetical protein